MSIRSELTTLARIVDQRHVFRVPIYQRLYVWGAEQVKTLLADLLAAWQDNKPVFYLGGTLVVEHQPVGGSRCFELIDGQQRFTTLWMLSLVWQAALRPFLACGEGEGRRPRIAFPIRPEVEQFFAQRMAGADAPLDQHPQLVDALACMHAFLQNEAREVDIHAFSRFVFENVQLVMTCVPPHTDLNKLFEVINNRGVQLQHHEILKAQLLVRLPDSAERGRYAQLWDACAYMGNYVEKNLKDVSRIRLTGLFDNAASTGEQEPLASAATVLAALAQLQQAAQAATVLSLADILAADDGLEQAGAAQADDESYESDDVRSIVSFPMLLQHVLRIWLWRNGRADLPRIRDNELLSLFGEYFLKPVARPAATPEQVRGFIELLWELRYRFDKHVIKWVDAGEEKLHLICRLRLKSVAAGNKTRVSLVREQPAANDGFALLQSMLYHSQQITTHYWLTPLLAYIHRRPAGSDQYFAFLRHLDNQLLCGSDSAPLIERSRRFLDHPWWRGRLDCSQLQMPLGTGFPHYWFYKLEFILWDQLRAGHNDPHWDGFRLTAKNSVEHIWPQTSGLPANLPPSASVTAAQLDHFGNLALVSRGINSEYGNKSYGEKRALFLAKQRKENRIDSLKMALIYAHASWNDALADQHGRQMRRLIGQYLANYP